jgi:hypothetical protein
VTKEFDQQHERLEVLLALALDQQNSEDQAHAAARAGQWGGACPDIETLVAWHEQRLGQEERNSVIRHLCTCSDCYRIWSELAEPLDELFRDACQSGGDVITDDLVEDRVCACEEADVFGQGLNEPCRSCTPAFFDTSLDTLQSERSTQDAKKKIRSWRWFAGWGLGGATVAIGLVLVVLLLPSVMRLSSINQMVDKGYHVFPPSPGDSAQPPFAAIAPLSKSLSRQASGWDRNSPSMQSFGYGIRQGLEQTSGLSPDDRQLLAHLPAPNTVASESVNRKVWMQRKFLVAAGRWTVLLSQACRHPEAVSPAFWEEQGMVLRALSTGFREYSIQDDTLARFFFAWEQTAKTSVDYCDGAAELLEQYR